MKRSGNLYPEITDFANLVFAARQAQRGKRFRDNVLQIEEYLVGLRLKLHPVKSQLFETRHGANFLGFRVLPDRIRVRTENLRRSRKRLRKLQTDYAHGKISIYDVSRSIKSWTAHLKHGDTWRLRHKIFTSVVFTIG